MPAIDCNVHYGNWPFPIHQQTLEELEALLRRFAVERACVSSALSAAGDLAGGNQALAEAIESKPFFLGVVAVSAGSPEQSLEEVRKHLPKRNFCAAKMDLLHHPQRLRSSSFQELMKALLRFDKPLIVQVSGSQDLDGLAEAAAAFPTERIMIADMGGADWPAFVEAAADLTNMFLACGGRHADRDKIKQAVDAVGPRRLLFGSGCPLVHPAFVLGMVRDSAIPAATKDRVLYRNAKELFNI